MLSSLGKVYISLSKFCFIRGKLCEYIQLKKNTLAILYLLQKKYMYNNIWRVKSFAAFNDLRSLKARLLFFFSLKAD